jgi:hypothetical protein
MCAICDCNVRRQTPNQVGRPTPNDGLFIGQSQLNKMDNVIHQQKAKTRRNVLDDVRRDREQTSDASRRSGAEQILDKRDDIAPGLIVELTMGAYQSAREVDVPGQQAIPSHRLLMLHESTDVLIESAEMRVWSVASMPVMAPTKACNCTS